MKNGLHFDPDHFTIHDLRKVIHKLAPEAVGPLKREDYLKLIMNESPSLVNPVMNEVASSNGVGEPDPAVEAALQIHGPAHPTALGADSASVAELKKLVLQTQEGVATFAEDVDKRVEQIEAIARRLLDHEPLRIVVEKPSKEAGGKPVETFKGLAHREFPNLLAMARAEVNILMVGPAGSGKTTGAEQLSKAMGLEFYFNGAIDSEYKLKGFVDAQGRLIQTEFRKAFEHGGVYLFDEVDASLPSATMAFNAALANGWCDFPDGRVNRHPDTVIIAAANTFLGGATFEYVGRNKQDAAFTDRFVSLSWDIDEALEMALCPNKNWCLHVQRLRANAAKKSLKVIISPRASIFGAKLLSQGLSWEFAETSAIRKGMTADQWKSIS